MLCDFDAHIAAKYSSALGEHAYVCRGQPGCRVYVGNLSWDAAWQDLKDHMRGPAVSRCCVNVCVHVSRCKHLGALMYTCRMSTAQSWFSAWQPLPTSQHPAPEIRPGYKIQKTKTPRCVSQRDDGRYMSKQLRPRAWPTCTWFSHGYLPMFMPSEER
jgi:hypothetical protein